MAHYDIHEDTWGAFQEINERLLGASPQHTLDTYQKELRRFGKEYNLEDLLGLNESILYQRRSLFLYCHMSLIAFQRHRRPQLEQHRSGFFAYRADDDCNGHHRDLDRVCLPWDHPIWSDYLPPNAWKCGCRIFAIGFARQAIRQGFEPGGPRPSWLGKTDPQTALPVGIEAGFEANRIPEMWDALVAVSDGLAD